MANMCQELAIRAVTECANLYKFDASDAIRRLGLNENVKIMNKKAPDAVAKKGDTQKKEIVAKPAFPLPYNGELNELLCHALCYNGGLYTQCQMVGTVLAENGELQLCKKCKTKYDSNESVLEHGTIQQRLAVGIMDYIDPSGKKPVAYTKIMKKRDLTEEAVLEEASKFNIQIDPIHFVSTEEQAKRGRPSCKKEKPEKQPTGAAKGRPKKSKKVVQITGNNDDLFAALVAEAKEESNDEEVEVEVEVEVEEQKNYKSNALNAAAEFTQKVIENAEENVDSEKESTEKEALKAAEKAEKEAAKAEKEAAKAEKEAAKAAEKAEKEAKKAAEKAEKGAKKEAKKVTEKPEKETKKPEKETKKPEKETKKAEKVAEKETKKPVEKVEEPVDDDEEDVVDKIKVDGKDYLKSQKTGIIYDYEKHIKEGKQVMIGKWNKWKNVIDFYSTPIEEEEEEEEEYDEESDYDD